MQKRRIAEGIELDFPPEERQAADIVEEACRKSLPIIEEAWGLSGPRRCRIYLVTSPLRFFFPYAPWYYWAIRISVLLLLAWLAWISLGFDVVLVVSIVAALFRARRIWRMGAGWTLRYRNCPVIVIKSPRLLAQADIRIGSKIFLEEPDPARKLSGITCHELTHACSASLKLPLWLNEGIAMLTVDSLFGRQTVRSTTLQSLNHPRHRGTHAEYKNLGSMKNEAWVYHYVRGYWLTRYLRDTQPGLLRELLAKRHTRRALRKKLAAASNLSPRSFWKTIDERLLAHFASISEAPN